MIKKYFALSLITASMVVAGCSSDNDPDPVTGPVADITDGSSAYDVVANSADHTTLTTALMTAGLADSLDAAGTAFTIFAPTNAAFAALDVAAPGTVDALLADPAALTRVLQFHVLQGTVDATQLSDGVNAATEEAPFTQIPLLGEGVLTFTNPEAGLSISDATITTPISTPNLFPQGTEAMGVVHFIDVVLTPPEAPATPDPDPGTDPDPDPGTGTPPVSGGAVDATLAGLGTFEIFRTAVSRDFGDNLDVSAWTVFVPSDAALGAAGLTDLTAAEQQAHIISSGALDPAALEAAGSVLASNGTSTHAVVNTGGALSVGGNAVELIATGAGGAQIYSIDGVLP